MRQILESTEAEGSTFMLRGGAPTYSGPQDLLSRQLVHMEVHTGGSWTVQSKRPGSAIWVDTDISFTGIGQKAFWASQEFEYRVAGGTVGAEAHATGVWRVAT